MRLNRQIATRQYKVGYCAICATYGPLTDDHIFPDAVRQPGTRELRTLQHHVGGDPEKPRLAQGGAKYRTLCNRCNTDLLGCEYDPALARLCRQVSKPIEIARRANLSIPNRLNVRYKPMRVARSVIGHSLAAHIIQDVNEPSKQGPFQVALRQFVLDPTATLPSPIEVYWWFYPSALEVAINYAAILHWPSGQSVLGSFLKFFPFAFWIVYDRPVGMRINLPQLATSQRIDIDHVIDEPFLLQSIRRTNWPESPGDNEALLAADKAYVASVPRAKARRPRI